MPSKPATATFSTKVAPGQAKIVKRSLPSRPFISFTKDAESSKLEFVKVNRVGYGSCIGIAQSFMWSALGEKMGSPILYPKASHIDLDAVSSVPPLCCGGF